MHPFHLHFFLDESESPAPSSIIDSRPSHHRSLMATCFKLRLLDEMLVKMQGEQSNNQVECFDVFKAATKYIDEEIQQQMREEMKEEM
ncbi:hypothetical protein E3N88_01538 [Mikania micrantha]|uniref:Uncharacterized protein n=1 Tax=Mikania micrantha TaxID=192012 RepID=A0A5N6Q1G4_9ASTR|nr:hypothetical protein E3N88_01538 [Mikania micrantha]